MGKKKCSKCGGYKALNCFTKSKNGTHGVHNYCAECQREYNKTARKTKSGVISMIYSNQKIHSDRRGHEYPLYTIDELREWLLDQPLFHELYEKWVESNYNKELKPSCDRKDDSMGYSLDRLQLMTWEKNNSKGNKSIRECDIIVKSNPQIPIVSVNRFTGEVSYYKSASEAKRKTGLYTGNICSACKKKQKYAKDWYFYYAEEYFK